MWIHKAEEGLRSFSNNVITSRFKDTYKVKKVETYIPNGMKNIKGAIFLNTVNKRSFSDLNDHEPQPKTETMDDLGDKIIFHRQGELQLSEVKVFVDNNHGSPHDGNYLQEQHVVIESLSNWLFLMSCLRVTQIFLYVGKNFRSAYLW